MFHLAAHKDALVRDVWDTNGRGGGWSPFTRSFNEWEMGEVENFLHTNHSLKVILGLEDKLIRKECGDVIYSVFEFTVVMVLILFISFSLSTVKHISLPKVWFLTFFLLQLVHGLGILGLVKGRGSCASLD